MGSKEHDNGGWAFAQPGGGGMSMLEWYGGQALAQLHGSITQENAHRLLTMYREKATDAEIEWAKNVAKNVAVICFDVAEAMIAENARRMTAEQKPEFPKPDLTSTVITCRNCNKRKAVDVPDLCNECL